MKRDTAEWLACMLLASVALVYSIWVVPYIPTQDGPHHILSAHIENHYSDPGSLYPEFYLTLPQFAGKGFALLFGPLESFLPWRVALRMTFSLIALAFAWGFALVVLALDNGSAPAGASGSASSDASEAPARPVLARDRRATTLLGFLIALPWSLYMGFFAFVIGTTLGLYTLAFVLYRPPTTLSRRAVLSLLLLLQGVCHIFTALLTGAMVLVLAVLGAPKEERVREAGRIALVGTPVAALLLVSFRERNAQRSSQMELEWGSLSARLDEISRWFVPGPGARAWVVIALFVVAGIGATLARARRSAAAKQGPDAEHAPTRLEQTFAWLGLAFVGLALFAPLHIPGWQLLAPRFALLAAVLGLALIRPPRLSSPLAARALLPVVTACCIGSSLVSASLHRQLATGCADALAGLDAPLRFSGARLSIIFDAACGAPGEASRSPIPGANLAYNTPLLYLLDGGGVAPRLFAGSPSIHAVAIRPDGRMPLPDPLPQTMADTATLVADPKMRGSVLTELAADGMRYEGIHVVGGRPGDFAVFSERGYVTELARGSLLIARYEGCPAELLLPPGSLDREPVYYEYGLFYPVGLLPEPRAAVRQEIAPTTPVGANGLIHVPLAQRPCGEIWLRVVWDADRSSTFTPGDRTCQTAVRDGRTLANVSRDRPAVLCAPPP